MRNRHRKTRHRFRDDHGFNLVELIIAMTIFSALMGMIFAMFIIMIQQAEDNQARVRAVDQARLGLSQIDRQIRSGNVIIDPSNDSFSESGVPANYSLRVYTQEDGDDKCVQWRVIHHDDSSRFGDLEFREWDAGDPSTATPWSNVANNLVAPTAAFDEHDPESWPPFWLDSRLPSDTQAQNIRITLRMGDPKADASAQPATVSSVVTGRNTVFGYSPDYCSSIPTV